MGLRASRLVDLDSARAIVGDSADAAVARLAAERSITLVRDSSHQLPLGRLNHGARILSVTFAHRADLGAGLTFDAELRKTFPALRPEYVDADDARPNFFSAARDRGLGRCDPGELVRGAQLDSRDDQRAAGIRGFH